MHGFQNFVAVMTKGVSKNPSHCYRLFLSARALQQHLHTPRVLHVVESLYEFVDEFVELFMKDDTGKHVWMIASVVFF